ncbi:MAG: hypothetical protein ACI9OU_002335 [Candidatus Promineifilaceae bacterium]|jgi:hypothetical protein
MGGWQHQLGISEGKVAPRAITKEQAMKLVTVFSVFGILVMPIAGMAQGVDLEAVMKHAQQQFGQSQQQAAEMPDVIKLSEADVTRFISTVTQLRKLGLTFDQEGAKQGPAETMKALAANGKAKAVLVKNKMTAEHLSQVGYSVAMAIASLEVDKDAIAKAKAQSAQAIESMRSKMSAAQFEMMKQQMGASMKMVDQMQDQPAQNVKLVQKHRKALEASFE